MLVYGDGKRLYAPMGVAKQSQSALNGIEALQPRHSLPRGLFAVRHCAAVQFDIMYFTQVEGGNEVVHASDQMVRLTLIHRDAGEDEVALVEVLDGAGIVQVQNEHMKMQPGGGTWPPTDRVTTALPTAKTSYLFDRNMSTPRLSSLFLQGGPLMDHLTFIRSATFDL